MTRTMKGLRGRRFAGASLSLAAVASFALAGCTDEATTDELDRIAEQQVALELPVDGQAAFRLQSTTGTVRLRSGDVAAVQVLATKQVASSDLGVSERHLADIEIGTADTLEMLMVTTDQPEPAADLKWSVDYQVTLPPLLAAEVFHQVGDIYVVATDGDLLVNSGTGDVTLYELSGQVAVLLDEGDISAALSVPHQGVVDLATRSGAIELSVPGDTSADLVAVATDGEIEITDLELTPSSDPGGSSLSGTLGAGEAHIGLWALAGDIAVAGY